MPVERFLELDVHLNSEVLICLISVKFKNLLVFNISSFQCP